MDTEELIDNIKIKVEEEYYEESEFFSRTYAFDIKQETAGESINHYISIGIKTEQSQTLLMNQCFVVIEKCPSVVSIRKRRFESKTFSNLQTSSSKCSRVYCDQCEKSYTCEQNLKRHMLIHQGIKPFKSVKSVESVFIEKVF